MPLNSGYSDSIVPAVSPGDLTLIILTPAGAYHNIRGSLTHVGDFAADEKRDTLLILVHWITIIAGPRSRLDWMIPGGRADLAVVDRELDMSGIRLFRIWKEYEKEMFGWSNWGRGELEAEMQ